ncbi:MAG: hypothetical protein VXX15_05935 [Planctomycetota bacterium]|nr:hypothetical protein [Planctomycetota bacterium]
MQTPVSLGSHCIASVGIVVPPLQRRAGKVVILGIVLFLVVVGALVLAASAGEYDPDVMDPSSPDAPMYEEEYYSED